MAIKRKDIKDRYTKKSDKNFLAEHGIMQNEWSTFLKDAPPWDLDATTSNQAIRKAIRDLGFTFGDKDSVRIE